LVHVALLRGINVGGKNKLPMKDLAALFAAAGCTDVKTLIQSGNVVFRAGAKVAKNVPAVVQAAIAKRFGLTVPVLTRSAEELAAVVTGNPFLAAGADPGLLHVAFMSTAPSADAVAALDPRRSPPDELAVRGREIYLMMPNGMGKTKITNAWLDTRLRTVTTVRNWRTVLALHELSKG
jgi:uncharacterized protein (DUF1697 family)